MRRAGKSMARLEGGETITARDVWHDLGGGWWRLTVPDPYRGANVYLLVDDGIYLVDAGHGSPGTLAFLVRALEAKGISPESLAGVIYTHPHVDHMGGGVLLAEQWPQVQHLAHQDVVEIARDYPGWVARTHRCVPDALAGYYPELAGELTSPATRVWAESYYLAPGSLEVVPLADGQEISLGRTRLEILYTPGHQEKHIALYCPQRRAVITGDLLIGSSTSIQLFTGGNVGQYYRSLDLMRGVSADLLYPGHGNLRPLAPALDLAEKTVRSQEEEIKQILSASPLTAAQVAGKMFPHLPPAPGILLTLGLVLSHLTHLAQEGTVKVEERDGIRLYRRS